MTAYEVHWNINGKVEPMPALYGSRTIAAMYADKMEIGRTGMLMVDVFTYSIVKVWVQL